MKRYYKMNDYGHYLSLEAKSNSKQDKSSTKMAKHNLYRSSVMPERKE